MPLAASTLPSRAEKPPPLIRIVGHRLTLQDDSLVGTKSSAAMRRLLELAFSLPEIGSAVVKIEAGSVSFTLAGNARTAQGWQRLGALLQQTLVPDSSRVIRTGRLPLQSPAPGLPVRVSRFGRSLTTFRVRALTSGRLRIAHPLLRDRHITFRLLEALGAAHGVVSVRAARVWGSVTIAYDPNKISPEHIVRFLDDSWVALLQGPLAPPRPRKLAVATSLLAFSFTAQFLRRALLPWATLAAALYNLPNVINAARDLRRRKVGMPAMYTLGFGFLLWFSLPFVSTLFSSFTQMWPQLAARLAMDSEKRLFVAQRRHLIWARLSEADGGEIEIDVAALRPGMVIVVHGSEYIPADGVVVEGLASVRSLILSGLHGTADKLPGDTVHAGDFVSDGSIAIRVVQAGAATAGAALRRALPSRPISDLPSLQEVERIGHRNARLAFVVSTITLLATRIARYSQVIIRPDYVTAPRLSAHLSALEALAQCLPGGALIRNPASLDLLLAADICVLDDSSDFARRRLKVLDIVSSDPDAGDETLRLAVAAVADTDDPRAVALIREAKRRRIFVAQCTEYRRIAGAVLFRDETGTEVRVMTPALAKQEKLYVPNEALANDLKVEAASPHADAAMRSFAVVRGRNLLGLIRFERSGPPEAADAVAALRQQLSGIRFVYLSSAPQEEAEKRALELGLDAVFGDLQTHAKTAFIRSLSVRAIWIGDGSDPETALPRAAAAISVSTAGIEKLASDGADITLLSSDLRALSTVWLAAGHRVRQLNADYRIVYLSNTTSIAVGLLGGFGSFQVGLISNIGTAVVFLSRWRALNSLALRRET